MKPTEPQSPPLREEPRLRIEAALGIAVAALTRMATSNTDPFWFRGTAKKALADIATLREGEKP